MNENLFGNNDYEKDYSDDYVKNLFKDLDDRMSQEKVVKKTLCTPNGTCQYIFVRGNKTGELCGKPASFGQIACRECLQKFTFKNHYEIKLIAKAAEIFALTVFLSDDFLTVSEKGISKEKRFFQIIENLPMELQMVLCQRSIGCSKINIPTKDSEPAFKKIAKLL